MDRISTYQGVARLVYLLTRGAALSTAEVAEILGRSRITAYRCLASIEGSCYVPLFLDKDTVPATWRILGEENEQDASADQ